MARNKRLVNNEHGFTLIEIIAVLVLLGILAAVAVPKYISLQEEAEMKTIDSVKAELQSRAMMYHGQYLLDNSKTAVAKTAAKWGTESVGDDFTVSEASGKITVQPTGSSNIFEITLQVGTTGSNAQPARFGTIAKQ